MMKEETFLKMKSQATTAMLEFCKGLMNDEEEEEEASVNGREILTGYVEEILEALKANLGMSIQ